MDTVTWMGLTLDDTPIISRMLKILEPITFPRARPFSPFLAATMLVTSSGREVPRATTVRPMRFSLRPKADARALAQSTTMPLPRTTAPRPAAM